MVAKDPNYFKKYYKNNKEKLNKYSREYYRNTIKLGIKPKRNPYTAEYESRRNYFIEMYGGKCNCCGETIKDFLTIEHINGQKGEKKETSYTAYSKAIKDYRPDLYEILCYNCNCVKAHGKICPHKI